MALVADLNLWDGVHVGNTDWQRIWTGVQTMDVALLIRYECECVMIFFNNLVKIAQRMLTN